MPQIIVGTDGSPHSRRALEWAVQEAGVRNAPLTVLTVHQAIVGYWGAVTYPGDQEMTEQARKVATEEVEELLGKLGDAPRPPAIDVRAVNGLPAEELLNAAAEQDADLIVVGARGAGGFARLLMGSVSTQVTHHAHCPVVIVPPEGKR